MERNRGTGRHVWQVLLGFGLEKTGAFKCFKLGRKNTQYPEALTPIYVILCQRDQIVARWVSSITSRRKRTTNENGQMRTVLPKPLL